MAIYTTRVLDRLETRIGWTLTLLWLDIVLLVYVAHALDRAGVL